MNLEELNKRVYRLYQQNMAYLTEEQQKQTRYRNQCYAAAIKTIVAQYNGTLTGDTQNFTKAFINLGEEQQYKIINKIIKRPYDT
jgi:ribosomal protein S20